MFSIQNIYVYIYIYISQCEHNASSVNDDYGTWGATGSPATGAKVTEESQEVQDEIPSANADWESSVVGEPSSEKFSNGESSSAEKGSELEENSSANDDSCIVGDSCKVCEMSLTGERD